MAIAQNDLPPYPLGEMLAAPFPERIRLICRSWAAQIGATPISVMAMYWIKYLLLFVGGWAFFVSLSANYPGFLSVGEWAFSWVAFQKAIVWAIFYESAGFGCSSGPMNARFSPPLGGFLHFLRPGTTKLPLFAGIPVFGGFTRSWLDVALYALSQLLLLRALIAPEITPDLLVPVCILIPILGITDKTLFLAARAEHYLVALICFAFASADGLWISGCKVVWCFIWFWAATSKVNHHFASVIMVMMNNGPFFPSVLKKRLFVSYPDDLRPSKMANRIARFGTVTEYAIAFGLLATAGNPALTAAMLVVMASFHGYIAINNPSGMPIEWNIVMIYGGVFLFAFNPEHGVLAIGALPLLTAFLLFCLLVVPLYGNFVPKHVSFLLAMRYYAGNWAYNIWLFRGDSAKKLHKLKKAAGLMREQLEGMIDDPAAVDAAMAMTPASRFLHLEGRPLLDALPKAVDHIDNYEWMEGEIVTGLVLGWNFGDGHLGNGQLVDAVREQCGFEEGELRVIAVESQPLFGRTMAWKIIDGVTGVLEEGETEISPMRALPAWPTGEHAEALLRGNPERGVA